MQKRAPSTIQMLMATGFAFSCFALLLFLWSAFGGTIPFKPEGYKVVVPVNEATQLAEQSDVRISNVSVGKVTSIELSDSGETRDRALATIELDDRYAPIPVDSRATLRQKTLLGETYVELSPGTSGGETIPEGGTLSPAKVADSVQLDEIFRAFDPRTRDAFRIWMQQGALATRGRGADISAAIGNLEPFARDAADLLRVLDAQKRDLGRFVKNTGVVFGALSERQGQLRGLISNAGTVFATTARRNDELRQTFQALPTFLDESRLTLDRLERFAETANPVITQLRPAGRELSGTLTTVARVAPDLRRFFTGFRKLAVRSKRGLPALQTLLDDDLPPLLDEIQPFTQQLGPIVEGVNRYRREVTGVLGNATASLNAGGTGPETNFRAARYLRGAAVLAPESFAAFTDTRLQSNRSNPYTKPGGALLVGSGLESFETRACDGAPGDIAALDPASPLDAGFAARATYFDPQLLFDRLKLYAFGDEATTATVPRPACIKQVAQASIGQIPELTDYPHVYQEAP